MHSCALLGRMQGRSDGRLGRLRHRSLERWARPGRGARTKLGGSKAHPGHPGTCVEHRVDVRDYALKHGTKVIHRLIRWVPESLASIPPLLSDHPGVQRVQHHAGWHLGARVLALTGGSGMLLLQGNEATYVRQRKVSAGEELQCTDEEREELGRVKGLCTHCRGTVLYHTSTSP